MALHRITGLWIANLNHLNGLCHDLYPYKQDVCHLAEGKNYI